MAGSYPSIILTVNVASNAPASLTTTATVSGGGDVNSANNFATNQVQVLPPPNIVSFAPPGGAVGATVAIIGSNFGSTQGASVVKFNGTPASITSWGLTSILAFVPAGATTGLIQIIVNGVAAFSSEPFAVGSPSITSLSLPAGPEQMGFKIAGSGFGATQGTSTVKLNGQLMTPVAGSWSDASITVQVPAGATTGNVVVTVGTTNSNGLPFTVQPSFGCVAQ